MFFCLPVWDYLKVIIVHLNRLNIKGKHQALPPRTVLLITVCPLLWACIFLLGRFPCVRYLVPSECISVVSHFRQCFQATCIAVNEWCRALMGWFWPSASKKYLSLSGWLLLARGKDSLLKVGFRWVVNQKNLGARKTQMEEEWKSLTYKLIKWSWKVELTFVYILMCFPRTDVLPRAQVIESYKNHLKAV